MIYGSHQECTKCLVLLLLWVGGASVLQPFYQYGGAYSFLSLTQSHLIPPPSLHGEEASSFPGWVSHDNMVSSIFVVGIKPGDASVVIGYQVDAFTHTWLVKHFVAQSHIYIHFTGKVSMLTHFLFEPRCEDYSFLGPSNWRLWAWFDFILTDSTNSPELDAPFYEADVVPSSVSSGFLCSVSTISDNSRLYLAPNIKCQKLWCQARVLLLPLPQAGKMSASKLIHYFSSHPAAFGFWASLPPDDNTLNTANKRTDQSLFDFQTRATVNTEQLISHTRGTLVDTIACLQSSNGGVIAASEVHEVLRFVTFWTVLCLNRFIIQLVFVVYLSSSAFRQCEEV